MEVNKDKVSLGNVRLGSSVKRSNLTVVLRSSLVRGAFFSGGSRNSISPRTFLRSRDYAFERISDRVAAACAIQISEEPGPGKSSVRVK